MSSPYPSETANLELQVCCPLCGQVAWGAIQRGTALRRCRTCGTWLNARSRNREEEERLYDGCDSVPVQDQSAIALSYWELVQAAAYQFSQGSPDSVLDIGCGTGDFLHVARAAGAQVAGMELDPIQAAASRVRGITTVQGSVFDVPLPAGPWQVITFWDVLDHLDDPARALRAAVEELAPGGLMVVRGRNSLAHVPAKLAIRRMATLFGNLGVTDVSVVHRWSFTPNVWCRLLSGAGLENINLYPGLPTPGDRYRSLGKRSVADILKTAIRYSAGTLHAMSRGRAYLFPTVIAIGQKSG